MNLELFVKIILIISLPLNMSCGTSKYLGVKDNTSNQQVVKEFEQYGIFDESKNRDKRIEYNLVWGNLMWSIFLYPAPVLIGWYLYEPVGVKDDIENCGRK